MKYYRIGNGTGPRQVRSPTLHSEKNTASEPICNLKRSNVRAGRNFFLSGIFSINLPCISRQIWNFKMIFISLMFNPCSDPRGMSADLLKIQQSWILIPAILPQKFLHCYLFSMKDRQAPMLTSLVFLVLF